MTAQVGDLTLLSEPRGNVPQALSHVGLIYAAWEIERALEAVPA